MPAVRPRASRWVHGRVCVTAGKIVRWAMLIRLNTVPIAKNGLWRLFALVAGTGRQRAPAEKAPSTNCCSDPVTGNDILSAPGEHEAEFRVEP
jgi:hypothetical protein